MVGAQNPQRLFKQFLESSHGTRCVPRLRPPADEVLPNGKNVGVVGARSQQHLVEQLLQGGYSADQVSRLPPPMGELFASGIGVGMVQPQMHVGSAGYVLEVVDSRG